MIFVSSQKLSQFYGSTSKNDKRTGTRHQVTLGFQNNFRNFLFNDPLSVQALCRN